jgi:hypothetical protein
MQSAFLGDPMIAIMPLVTQIWSCVMCPWEGENPTLYMLKRLIGWRFFHATRFLGRLVRTMGNIDSTSIRSAERHRPSVRNPRSESHCLFVRLF